MLQPARRGQDSHSSPRTGGAEDPVPLRQWHHHWLHGAGLRGRKGLGLHGTEPLLQRQALRASDARMRLRPKVLRPRHARMQLRAEALCPDDAGMRLQHKTGLQLPGSNSDPLRHGCDASGDGLSALRPYGGAVYAPL